MKVKFQMNKQKSPQSERGMKVAYGEAKRTGYRLRWFALLGLILLPVIFVAYYIVKPQVFTIASGVVSYEPISIKSPRESVVESVYFEVGDTFSNGEFLVQLQNSVLEDEIEYLEQQIRALKAYSQQRADNFVDLYLSAQRDANKNLQEIEKIKREFEAFNKEGLVSTGDYAAILNNYYAAQERKSKAALDLALARQNEADEQYVGSLANITRQLELELNGKRSQKRELLISAPFDGHVIDVLGQRGERLQSQTDIITVAESSARVRVVAYLDPKHSDKALLARKVTVRLPNGSRLNAHVSSPTELASKLPIQLSKPFEGQKALLEVLLTIDEPLPSREELIEGMPVEVYF